MFVYLKGKTYVAPSNKANDMSSGARGLDFGIHFHLHPGPKVIKLFILNFAEHEIYLAHKC